MKSRIPAICLLLAFMAQSVCSSAFTGKISYRLEDFKFLQSHDTLTILPLDADYYFSDDTMRPALPISGTNLYSSEQLPQKALTCTALTKELVASDVWLVPNPKSIPIGQEMTIIPEEKVTYELKSYPEEPVKLTHCGKKLNGTHIYGLTSYPFIYNAETRELYFISEMEYTIEGDVVRNEDEIAVETTIPESDIVDYLIIQAAGNNDDVERLRDWKTMRGVKTEIVDIGTVTRFYNGNNIQECTKDCIRHYVQNHGTKWVLLLGDVYPRICQLRNGIDQANVPVDMYFSCFGDFSWDANGNGRYGERSDNVSLIQDVCISRLPLTSEAVEGYVDKLIRYEKGIMMDDWHETMLFSGVNTGMGSETPEQTFNSAWTNRIRPHYPDFINKAFVENYNNLGLIGSGAEMDSINLAHVLDSIHPHFFSMDAHGSDTSWCWKEDSPIVSNDLFNTDNMYLLSNDSLPMIIVTCACNTNKFDSWYDPCLSEAFIRKAGGGALAYWGSSDLSWGSRSGISHSPGFALEYSLFRYLDENDNHFGSAVNASKMSYLSSASSQDSYRWQIMAMNAIGDCELPIYTCKPKLFYDIDVCVSPTSVVMKADSAAHLTVSSVGDNGGAYYHTVDTDSASFSTGVMSNICSTRKNFAPFITKTGRYQSEDGYAALYLQNSSYNLGKVKYCGEYINVGNDIDTNQEQGNVVVENGGTLTLKADVRARISGGFKCERGGIFRITNH